MNQKICFELQNISYNIWSVNIFNKINATIYEKEIISILWYNWAWKSSLLKTILGSIKPSHWKIEYSKWIKKWYVPQKLSFDRKLPISVRDFLYIYNQENTSILENYELDFLSIRDLLDKPISWLSGWQLQKILIYNALLDNPNLLLLDEPTSWLDINSQKNFYTMLEKIHEKLWCTIVIVSHDIHTVYNKSDQVICLHNWVSYIWKPSEKHIDCNIKDFFWSYVSPYIHHHHDK